MVMLTTKTMRWARWLALFGVFALLVRLDVIKIGFEKLGLSPWSATGLLLLVVVTRPLKIHIGDLTANRERLRRLPEPVQKFMLQRQQGFADRTAVDMSIGGFFVPLVFVAYLAIVRELPMAYTSLETFFVMAVAHLSKGRRFSSGVDQSAVWAPLTAVLAASLFVATERGAAAFVSGTVGVLVGADLLHLNDIGGLGSSSICIGDVDSLDAILLTGILALLMT